MLLPEGIYRVYRHHPGEEGDVQQRMVARFAIVADRVEVLEDHDDILDSIVPGGRLTDKTLSRLVAMKHSPYWRLVNEDDLKAGEHPDLLPEVEG